VSRHTITLGLALTSLHLAGCKPEEPEPEPLPQLGEGEACDPNVEPPPADTGEGETGGEEQQPFCAPGLACDPLADGSGYVCGAAYEIQGRITDSLTNAPIEGALIAAFDETGAPDTDVVASDACGDYILPIPMARDAEGNIVDSGLTWTLNVSASGYVPFPEGVRPALPLSQTDAVAEEVPPLEDPATEDEEPMTYEKYVIANAATSVALIPLDDADAQGVTVTGRVDSELGPGALVVAEGGPGRTPYGIADLSGAFTLFNVAAGDWTIRAYRFSLEVEPAQLSVASEDVIDVILPEISTDVLELGAVEGTMNLVNAGGLSNTSVVLVPSSLFNENLERGPVPFGLREPDPPLPVADLMGAFTLDGVPSGTYKVLAAFENDDLVRDPDTSIAGTEIQEVTVTFGQLVTAESTFKITSALELFGPGAEAPELVDGPPTLSWADDSSEDFYEVKVFDALGETVWEDAMIPGVSGSDTVDVPYGGPALVSGMYYQFRATSLRDTVDGLVPISRTEDLRGVFFFGEPPAPEECTVPEDEGGTETTD
jgi:hypothetical protein